MRNELFDRLLAEPCPAMRSRLIRADVRSRYPHASPSSIRMFAAGATEGLLDVALDRLRAREHDLGERLLELPTNPSNLLNERTTQ